MKIKRLLDGLDFSPEKSELANLKKETANFLDILKEQIVKDGLDAEVFLGGSFAKGTLVRKYPYDIDIFIRFGWKEENLSDPLEKTIKKVCKKTKLKYDRVHGSRDYFQVKKDKNIIFEIVPVTKIKHPRESRNVTDLSYFHVNYVKNRIKKHNLAKQIILAKTFCRVQGVYGAESYIRGFSGYGLECIIIYYKTFEKMLKALSSAKERIVIDSEKKYKNAKSVLFELNESKLSGPIILVDPTWKERNALAALSQESFKKFQEAAKAFLKHPSKEFFEEKMLDTEKLRHGAKAKKAELLELELKTDRQEGDIAGTKLKKFSDFFYKVLEKYFEIDKKEFHYDDKHTANVYFILKSRKEIIKIGPPVGLTDNVKAFKKVNKNTFEKGGLIHARIKVDFSAKDFAKKFSKEQKSKIAEMNLVSFRVI